MVHLLAVIVNICKMRGTHKFKIVNWIRAQSGGLQYERIWRVTV